MEIRKNNLFIWIRRQMSHSDDAEAKPFTPHKHESPVF
jgi:hypothetical protein